MGARATPRWPPVTSILFVAAIMTILGVDAVIMPPIVASEVEPVGQATWYAGVTTITTPQVRDGARNVSTFGQLGGIVCVGYEDVCYIADRVCTLVLLFPYSPK
jgi:hypothetical protein